MAYTLDDFHLKAIQDYGLDAVWPQDPEAILHRDHSPELLLNESHQVCKPLGSKKIGIIFK